MAVQDNALLTSDTICVVGLGYVGSVVGASLAARGRNIIGVDISSEVVGLLSRGTTPIAEPGVDERLARAFELGTIRCTTDLRSAIPECIASLVCVGTPLGEDGLLVESGVLDVCEAIARAVPKDQEHVIVIRSTVGAGHYERAMARIQQAVGDDAGTRITLALNPEFLREGSAIADFESPELIVFATEHDSATRFIEALHAEKMDRLVKTDPATSEMLKLVNNTWHALKVSFANEVARIAGPAGVDPFAVMELLCRDKRLNTSSAYLRPGMPFGGACLVKDVASLSSHAARRGADTPVLSSILSSNRAHLEHIVQAVLVHNPKQAAIVGVGFKPGAPDLRNSAPVQLIRELLDRGIHVTVADSMVLDEANAPLGLRAFEEALGDPRATTAPSVAHALAGADVVVVGHPSPEDRAALVALCPDVPVLDAAGELSRKLSDEERLKLAPLVVLASTAPPANA